MNTIFKLIEPSKQPIVESIKQHAGRLLDHSHRFKYFTLHGKQHIENLINISNILINKGLTLLPDEAFYLYVAICIHDLGMVVPLKDEDVARILGGKPQVADPANLELFIRDWHNELIDRYVESHFDFLTSLGLSPPEIGIIKDIARAHRKIPLEKQIGLRKKLGAFLRVIDELDIGPERAPNDVFLTNYEEMDSTSCWHWFKHNIVEPFHEHNFKQIESIEGKTILIEIAVRPPTERSMPYWTHQIIRPIQKVMSNEQAFLAILESWGIKVQIKISDVLSKPNYINKLWERIEQRVLSHGRKSILVIDDEVRKMEDLFIPLMNDFYVHFSPNAKDAIEKIQAADINLAIVDMQVSSGDIWTAEETGNYKITGKKMIEAILEKSPNTKIGILTGTRYNLDFCKGMPYVFFLKKPVDPEQFEGTVRDVLK